MQIDDFWRWFETIAAALSSDITNSELLEELDLKLHRIDPRLSWELGPGLTGEWQLVISPNLNPALREKASAIISGAPVLPKWEFYAARQPKEWNYQFKLEGTGGRDISLDASSWEFALYRYPDGAHEIVLYGDNLPPLESDQSWQAAAITLESILGEDALMERVQDFSLEDISNRESHMETRPIQYLRKAVKGY